MAKQVPIVDALVLGDGGAHLRAHKCTTCSAIFLDRRSACPNCGNSEFASQDLATTGVVRSFAIVQQAPPGVPVPFVAGIIDLDGGGHVKANIINVEPFPENVELGQKVKLATWVAGTDDEGTEAVSFGFELA